MKLTSPSSVLVTWDDQVAESFFLNIYLDTTGVNLWKHYIPGNNYTFTGLPSASVYRTLLYALFDRRLGHHTGHINLYVYSTTDCKFHHYYADITFIYNMIHYVDMYAAVHIIK